MATWAEFEAATPEMAAEGKRLLYQFGIGLGFLATVRPDGGPRLHPICPIVVQGGLYAFIVPSPKCGDLRRDGRYALHSFPPAEGDEAFYATGRATEVGDPGVRAAVSAAYHAPTPEDHALFAFGLERCLLSEYEHSGAWPPTYTRWVGAGAE